MWKTVENFERYQVSIQGEIRNSKGVILKQTLHEYPMVTLYKNGRAYGRCVHRLVAIAFVPNPNRFQCVDHIDGDKTNNYYRNLEWVSYSENKKRAYAKGLKTGAQKTKRPNTTSRVIGVSYIASRRGNKWVAYITKNKTHYHIGAYKTETEAANARREFEKMI